MAAADSVVAGLAVAVDSAAVAPAVEEPAAAGKRKGQRMTPEELIERLNSAVPGKLSSAVLYGSAAAGDFVPKASNYNVLLVIDGLGLAELDALSKPVAQWTRAGHRPPLLFTCGQLQASADAFPIELLDMQQSHRVLFGEVSFGQRHNQARVLVAATGTRAERNTPDVARGLSAYRRASQASGPVAHLLGCRGSGFVSGVVAALPGRSASWKGRCATAAYEAYPLRSAVDSWMCRI